MVPTTGLAAATKLMTLPGQAHARQPNERTERRRPAPQPAAPNGIYLVSVAVGPARHSDWLRVEFVTRQRGAATGAFRGVSVVLIAGGW